MSAGVLVLGCLGCLSRRDLSSYSDGATELADPADPSSAAGAVSGAPLDPMEPVDPLGQDAGGATPPVEEQSPEMVPLDVAPPNPAPSDANGSSTVMDPERCSEPGEFTIVESSSCYVLGDATSSWQEARDFCRAWGGDLVEIGSAEENAALRERSEGDVWIGANDRDEEGSFVWAGGGAVEFAAWAPLQPDDDGGLEDCAELRAFDDAWNDVQCASTAEKPGLCERQLPDPGK